MNSEKNVFIDIIIDIIIDINKFYKKFKEDVYQPNPRNGNWELEKWV